MKYKHSHLVINIEIPPFPIPIYWVGEKKKLLENSILDRISARIQGPEQTEATEPTKKALTTEVSTRDNSVQLLSHVRLFVTPWIAARQASLCITNSWNSLKLMSLKSVIASSHLILCLPLLLLPPIPPSIRDFCNESILHMRWPKYWSFSFSITPSKEHPGLISFRIDWLDLLAVQGTLKSLLLFKSSAFFKVAQPKAFLG